MSADHEHSHEHAPEQQVVAMQQPQPRRPVGVDSPVVTHLNRRLDEKAGQIRRLEDSEVALQALVSDMDNELAAVKAMMDQVVAENKMLREKCGLPSEGALDLPTDEDAVDEVPEEGSDAP